MKALRNLLNLGLSRAGGSRFERYYSGVIRSGVGYPTADEARRDLSRHDRATQPLTWLR